MLLSFYQKVWHKLAYQDPPHPIPTLFLLFKELSSLVWFALSCFAMSCLIDSFGLLNAELHVQALIEISDFEETVHGDLYVIYRGQYMRTFI